MREACLPRRILVECYLDIWKQQNRSSFSLFVDLGQVSIFLFGINGIGRGGKLRDLAISVMDNFSFRVYDWLRENQSLIK